MPPAFCTSATTCRRQRGLAGGFRAVDLDDAAARQAADAERDVEAERAGGDDLRGRSAICASPIFMIEPLPNCFSICASAAASALLLLSSIVCPGVGVVRVLRGSGPAPATARSAVDPSMRRLWHRTIVRCQPPDERGRIRTAAGPAASRPLQRSAAPAPGSAPRRRPTSPSSAAATLAARTAARSPAKCGGDVARAAARAQAKQTMPTGFAGGAARRARRCR